MTSSSVWSSQLFVQHGLFMFSAAHSTHNTEYHSIISKSINSMHLGTAAAACILAIQSSEQLQHALQRYRTVHIGQYIIYH